MAYRGGNINIKIKGDASWNLDTHDFKILVYPDNRIGDALTLAKKEMVKINDNHYLAIINWQNTKMMKTGPYTIEVLVIQGEDSRSVFVKSNAFPLYDSASKDIE